jgi:Isopentenyldiphosphate isomerase
MEFLDILDESGNKTGRIVERGKRINKNEFHLVVNVWIKNNKGEFLITKRSPNKKMFPNMWETTCGAVIAGEDSLKAALREVKEEINIDLSPVSGKHLFRLKRVDNKLQDFVDVWLFKQEVDIREITYQPEEVSGAKWVTQEQIIKLIEIGEFTDTFPYLERLFNIV